ncbi:hypothetical protein [Anaerobium acetethylicum]|uniref:Uncharacterized protein n=1 Tax=Anaerobium acetethylicum TaxID=1619234 RepID=A0A1D3TX67_9FIRM|nr:hypothetical protein [Anaerobium acetethylicum]SCP98905.1 hypothetical protein SAMN05421730_102832 [Anaerobium acetethylicum]
MKQLSWKSNIKHAKLEYLIKELDPTQDLSRGGITNRAIVAANDMTKAMSKEEKGNWWEKVAKKIPELNNFKIELSVPTAMQVKLDDENEEIFEVISENIKKALGLEVLQTQYEIQILWMNYYSWLKEKAIKVGSEKEEDITGPEMVKRLVQILLLNRESDVEIIEEIKTALLQWEE